MSHRLTTSESLVSALKGFSLLLLALFATEAAVMGLLAAHLPLLDPLLSGLLDALLLCLFLTWPLWFFVTRALSGETAGTTSSTLRLWLKVLGVVLLAEFLVMQLPVSLMDSSNERLRDLLDAGLTTTISAPFLWRLLFRPGMRRRRDSMADLLGTPFGLYVLLLYMVFFTELLLERLLPLLFSDPLQISYETIDAIFSTLLLAPVLWLVVSRPLRQAILAERARIRAVHAQLIDAVVSLDAGGRIESFNPVAERIFGYAEAEVVGARADILLSTDQVDLVALLRGATLREEQGGMAPIYVVVGRRRDGSAVTMEVSLSRVLQHGEEEYLLLMRDIGGRKAMERALHESKERFRQIVEQSDDAIVFFKPVSMVLIDANATAEALFGRSRRELVAAGLEGLLVAPDAARLQTALAQLSVGESVQLDTLGALRADGTELFVSVRGKIVVVQKVNLVFVTFRDVTEKLRLEAEGREIQAQLIHANKMTSLGLMVSGVAHEINNPNNLILANASLLAQSWGDAQKILRDYARENGDFLIGGVPFSEFEAHAPQLHGGILDGSRRISAIVSELKRFARREQSGEEQTVDINQVATTATSIVHHELVKYTANFHLVLGENLPLVRGSSQQLGQVVVNLLMNSSQALTDRKSGIWLTTAADAASGEVVLTVRDNGCGMSAEVGRRIMEPFFTTRIDSGGTGLGLSICHSIIKKHQGSLSFTSTPGVGTEFVVRLPAQCSASETAVHDRHA